MALLKTPWDQQVDMSPCVDVEGHWRSSPAVMDYVECSGPNRAYLERLWSIEEAQLSKAAVDRMNDKSPGSNRTF